MPQTYRTTCTTCRRFFGAETPNYAQASATTANHKSQNPSHDVYVRVFRHGLFFKTVLDDANYENFSDLDAPST